MPRSLRTPGPTPLPPRVRAALAREMINHRGPEFAELLRACTQGLQTLFQTRNDILILTTSGTGALESAVTNLLSPGERTLAVSIGYFGDRFAEIARTFGADVDLLAYPWGEVARPEDVAARLAADPHIATVLVTHNETSTGVVNDLEEIARVVKGAGRLLVVDAISSIGSAPLPVDAWGCDVVLAGSQKGWMVPPGLAFVSVSPEAWERARGARMPRYYFDWSRARKLAERGATPWTPAVSLLFALREALALMLDEGLERIHARHLRLALATRAGLRRLGIRLFAPDAHASWTVTSAWVPEGITGTVLRARLRDEFDVVVAGGQGAYEETLFRIGHLGFVGDDDVASVLDALAKVLAPVARASRPA